MNFDKFKFAIDNGFTFRVVDSVDYYDQYYIYKYDGSYCFNVQDIFGGKWYETDGWETFKKIIRTIIIDTHEVDIDKFLVE